MKVVIAIQARLNSTRLPKKALLDLCGRPMIAQQMRRMRSIQEADRVVVACPEADRKEFFWATGVDPVTGPEEDVLTRMLNVATETGADKIVKVGADCPLVPPDGIAYGISLCKGEKLVQNWRPRLHPDGFDFDIWDVQYLQHLGTRLQGADREWFSSWAAEHDGPGKFIGSDVNLSKVRLTVDEQVDLDLVRMIYKDMAGEIWGARDIMNWVRNHPVEMKMNAHLVKDFGARPK